MSPSRPSYFENTTSHQQGARLTRRAILTGLGMTGAAAAAVGACYGAYAAGLFATPPELEKATGCRLDVKSAHTSIVLLDNTDPPTATQADRASARLEAVADTMPDYGRLVVEVLNPDDPMTPGEVFRRCAPRAPARTSALEGGAVYVRRQFTEEFQQPLIASTKDLLKSAVHAKRSPILASITGLTQRPDFDASVPERRLVIISDLIEHDDRKGGYSHMQKGDLVAAYRRSALVAALQPDLTNVKVVIDYLQRPNYALFQNVAHRAFWRWWLKEAGATEVTFLGIKEPAAAPEQYVVPRSAIPHRS